MPKRIPDGPVLAQAVTDDPAACAGGVAPASGPSAGPSARDARHAQRLQVVAFRRAGLTYDRIALLTGLSRTGVFDICKRQATWGDAGLHAAPGGQRPADGRRIDALQEASARQSIIESTPDRSNRFGSLWTHTAVSSLVLAQCGLHLPVRTLAAYLARWGFVAPRSLPRVLSAVGSADQQWLDGSYLAIVARARAEDAQLIWGDHRALADAASGERASRGSAAPLVRPAGPGPDPHTISSAVDARGRMGWVISAPRHDAAALIDFMRRLVVGARQKVFLLMRPHAVHHCRAVTAWLVEHEDAIELFDLPAVQPQ